MQELLIKLATHLQAMRFSSHFFHNTCGRIAFFGDHDFFKSVYESNDSDYDSIIERYIGLFGSDSLNLNSLITMSHEKIKSIPSQFKENYLMFNSLLGMEQELNSLCKAICYLPECSEGTKQLVGDIANASESRIYKIKRRLIK